MANYCRICRTEIHPKRVELGFKDTCPTHSNTSKYVGHLLVEGTSEYSIQVIKDPEIAKDLNRLKKVHNSD